MADNITALANTGTGTDVLATDEIAGVHYPRTKIGFGDDGSYTDASATNPLPVTLSGSVEIANNSGSPVPVASDRLETLIALMSRAVKLLDSNAIVDSAQRQRIVVDAGTITAVTGVTTVTTVTTVGALTTVAGMDREQYINISKQTMAQGIRSRLTFA
jgi:hypothetical protein